VSRDAIVAVVSQFRADVRAGKVIDQLLRKFDSNGSGELERDQVGSSPTRRLCPRLPFPRPPPGGRGGIPMLLRGFGPSAAARPPGHPAPRGFARSGRVARTARARASVGRLARGERKNRAGQTILAQMVRSRPSRRRSPPDATETRTLRPPRARGRSLRTRTVTRATSSLPPPPPSSHARRRCPGRSVAVIARFLS
jgi:hypothetical protein